MKEKKSIRHPMFGLGFNRNITLHNLGGAAGAGTTITEQDSIHAIPKSNNLCQEKVGRLVKWSVFAQIIRY